MTIQLADRNQDAQMKVSVDVLQRVYEAFQEGGDTTEGDFLDPESHLHFIDAYEMPLWNWSTERSAFERYVLELMLEQREINLDKEFSHR